MGLYDFLFGKEEKMQQVPTMNPQQMQMLQQMLTGMGGGGFGGGAMGAGMQNLTDILSNNPEAMQKFDAPYMRQFQQKTVPGLAERFAGMGSGGSMGSSAFNQSMGQAGAGLQEQLAALHGQMQQGAMGQLQGMMGMGLGAKPFENIFRPETQGLLGNLMQGAGQGMGTFGSMWGMSKLFPQLFGMGNQQTQRQYP